MHWICAMGTILATIAVGPAAPDDIPTAFDKTFNRIYNYDFVGAHGILDAEMRVHPEDPLIPAVRAAALLFAEFDRLKIMELEFFENDDNVTDKKRLKPNPSARKQLFEETAKARRLAQTRLAAEPNDANAWFALCTAAGAETDYVGLVEKKYFRAYSLSKESQKYARKLLALKPPFYDAYVTTGTVEYVVGNLNFIFRLFVRFDQIEGKKQKAIEDLKKAAENGRYYRPFAKTLLSAIYMRENQLKPALDLMKELELEFPQNPLIRHEIKRALEKLNSMQKKNSR
jgi:hypothetical protein